MKSSSFFKSFKYAFDGLGSAFKTQRNLRIHVSVGTIAILIGLWLKISRADWAILIITIGIVLSLELLNTSLEAVVDLVSPEYHPLAKKSKDVGAASVLVGAIMSVVIGILVLGPPLIQFLTSNLPMNCN